MKFIIILILLIPFIFLFDYLKTKYSGKLKKPKRKYQRKNKEFNYGKSRDNKIYDEEKGIWLSVNEIQEKSHPIYENKEFGDGFIIPSRSNIRQLKYDPDKRFALSKRECLELGFQVITPTKDNALKLLSPFSIIQNSGKLDAENVLKLDNCSVVYGKIHLNDQTKNLMVFCLELKYNLGHVFIREEDLSSKINDFFMPKEVKFEYAKNFCDKYYVLASDPHKIKSFFGMEFLNQMGQTDNLVIEIVDSKMCIISTEEIQEGLFTKIYKLIKFI